MSKITYFIKQSWLLMIASLFFGLVLATADAYLGPIIIKNQEMKVAKLCLRLVPEATDFAVLVEDAEIAHPKRTITTDILQGKDASGQVVGYAFIAEGPGFAGPIQIVIGTDKDLKAIRGFSVLASNETPGFGDKIAKDFFQNQFKGAPFGILELVKVGDPATINNNIVAISGATVSSDAVVNIFNTYVDSVKDSLVTKGIINGN